jgi:L-seryl-tRNA(Ser) seleniumtransferase
MSRSVASTLDLSKLPSVDQLLANDTVSSPIDQFGRSRVTTEIRKILDGLRSELLANEHAELDRDELTSVVLSRLATSLSSSRVSKLRRVINATGVVLHTNLGRAPLSENAIKAIVDVARGYSNLEFDVVNGTRGKRGEYVESLVCSITGAEAAIIVNNCAAAAFFVLSAFASGGEVIVSRGELVEIGGDFRVPDVLERSGATLREVGTTNRTKVADYEHAISENTKMILRVHPSNYRVVGFTASPTVAELAEIAARNKVVLFEDIGSGAITDLSEFGINDEPSPAASIAAGCDIVAFSGDKLLGGPQCGIIAGRNDLIDKLRKHPLYRALRVDKLTYAALGATLESYERGHEFTEIPALASLSETKDSIEARTNALIQELEKTEKLKVEIVAGNSAVGGGSAPLTQPETALIALVHQTMSAEDIASQLRANEPPIVTRIEDDRVLIDLRTVAKNDESDLIIAINSLS